MTNDIINCGQFLVPFFKKLSLNKINYCVLRNYRELPYSLGNSDLDILIDKKDVNDFYSILEQILHQSNGEIIIQYGKLTPRICIVSCNSNSWVGIQLDIHEGILPYRTANMFPIDFLFSRISVHNEIFVANDDDADLIAFLKEILNNKTCKEIYFNKAKKSWFNNKPLYVNELTRIYDDEFLTILDTTLQGDYNPATILALAKYGQFFLTKDISIKRRNLISSLSRFYRFFKPPGFSIAVLGTDGAGKTTIIDAIREPLNEAVHNALFYEHMRPNLIPNIAQLFGHKKHSGTVVNPHEAEPSGFIGSVLRLLYYSSDYIFGYWLKIYPVMVKKSSIWIFDRYYYDYLIDPKRARINLPSWVIKSVRFFIPEPDLILCLGAAPDVIHARKPELPLSEVTKQVNKLKLFCKNESRATWIDTGKPLDDTISQTLQVITSKMALRYS